MINFQSKLQQGGRIVLVTREDILATMREKVYRPMTTEELQSVFPQGERRALDKLLSEMEAEGDIIRTRKERYGLPEQMNLAVGRVQGHPKGFAFVITDQKEQEDIFVSADNLAGAMHNDRVVLRLLPPSIPSGRKEGEVIRILRRGFTRLVGSFENRGRYGYVTPDEKRIPVDIVIPQGEERDAKSGQKVVIEITQYPEKRRVAEGRVTEILGHYGAPGVDVLSIIRKFELPEEFPKRVIEALVAIPSTVTEKDLEGRRDLRGLMMVTIDGEDAKDLDDAVSLEMLPDGNFRLGVHIADVGYYVTEDSVLDHEAFERATSVYLVDRVIPMLPTKLSNDLCSLNPQVDRVAMTCMMNIDPRGRVVHHEIFPSVIHINERMTYKKVTQILDEKTPELMERYAPMVPMFQQMKELCLILRKRRQERGAIDFEFAESKVILDDAGVPVEIRFYDRGIADKIIEEFMLIANETVAEHFTRLEAPFVYRVHEEPDPVKIQGLREFLETFGHSLRGKHSSSEEIHPRALQSVLERVKGRPEERVISTVMLRSMKHARYAPQNLGHFGLSAKYYCHFTSPIRRYPDLVIHRIIREIITTGGLDPNRKVELLAKTETYAKQSSQREKVAEEAERESVDLKKVEYMERHLGETFRGVISGVTNFGLFVQLDNSVEGLVSVSALTDDFYVYNEKTLSLEGRHTKKTYRIGDAMWILVAKVNKDTRQIEFEPVQAPGSEVEIEMRDQRRTQKTATGGRDSRKQGAGKPPKAAVNKTVKPNDSTGTRGKVKTSGETNRRSNRRQPDFLEFTLGAIKTKKPTWLTPRQPNPE